MRLTVEICIDRIINALTFISLVMVIGSRKLGGTYMCIFCTMPNGSRSDTVFSGTVRSNHAHVQQVRPNASRTAVHAAGGRSPTVGLPLPLLLATAYGSSGGAWTAAGDGTTSGTSICKCCSRSSDMGCNMLPPQPPAAPPPSNSESGLLAARLSGARLHRSAAFSIRYCRLASSTASSLLQCSVPSTTDFCSCHKKNERTFSENIFYNFDFSPQYCVRTLRVTSAQQYHGEPPRLHETNLPSTNLILLSGGGRCPLIPLPRTYYRESTNIFNTHTLLNFIKKGA